MKLARLPFGAVRAFVGFFARPTMAGALYLLALSTMAARSPAAGDDERTLGHDAQAIARFVHERFGPEIRRTTLAVAAASIVIGALLGFLGGVLVQVRDHLERRAPRTPRGFARVAFVTTVVIHAWLMALGMARAPQLYAAAWYARGGALRTAQVIATDVLGPLGVALLGVVALLAFLAGPVATWPRWRGRFARAFLPHNRTWKRRASLITMSVALLLLGAVARAPLAERAAVAASGDRPNVLVIAVDSLRADRLVPRVAPRLSALADRGARFDRAYVSLPRTFPSWVTLLTGRHAHHHGVRSTFARWEDRAKDFDALPTRLARAGYRTGVVSDFAGDIFRRVDLGFGAVEAPAFNFRELVRERALEKQRPLLPLLQSRLGRKVFPVLRDLPTGADADMLADDAIRAMDRMRGAPFFLTVFFSAPHSPYASPAPYYDRFTRPAYRGRFKYDEPDTGAGAPPDVEDIAQIRNLYDGAVASVDDAAARILDALARRGLDRDTIVVVTADHGETLFDGGHGQGHGDHLFGDEGTHVPLVIYDPRRPEGERARREHGIARDVDLAPTLYELTGVSPPSDLDGRSLAPAMRGAPLEPALAYAETELWLGDVSIPPELRMPVPPAARLTEIDTAHGDEVVLARDVEAATLVARQRMVRDDRWKLLYLPTRSQVVYMLFDTERDPGETRDIAIDHPAEVARLKGELWRWMLEDPRMVESGGTLVVRDAAKPPASEKGTP